MNKCRVTEYENFDQNKGKKGVIFDLDFWVLTTILTKKFVPNGVYMVSNVDDPLGDDVRKMGNGAYVVMVSLRVALMPYVCD